VATKVKSVDLVWKFVVMSMTHSQLLDE